MRALVIFFSVLAGGAFGMFVPVLVAIALHRGSMSYEAFLLLLLVTIPLCAIGFGVGVSRRLARAPK